VHRECEAVEKDLVRLLPRSQAERSLVATTGDEVGLIGDDWTRVDDSVDERGGAGGVGEDGRPIAEGQVGREHDALLFVAARDDLKEQVGVAVVESEIADFVEDQQSVLCVVTQAPLERARRVLRCELEQELRGPDRYEPDINAAYLEMAQHYGMAVIPTRSM
jgi:hypothetical protein